MSKLRHTLQLLHGGALSTRQIGAALGISKSTVGDIASYARAAGVDWALAQSLSDEELQARLYKPPVARESRGGAAQFLDWFQLIKPRLSRYSMGLREPRDILSHFSFGAAAWKSRLSRLSGAGLISPR